jgi:hypothetical protein
LSIEPSERELAGSAALLVSERLELSKLRILFKVFGFKSRIGSSPVLRVQLVDVNKSANTQANVTSTY